MLRFCLVALSAAALAACSNGTGERKTPESSAGGSGGESLMPSGPSNSPSGPDPAGPGMGGNAPLPTTGPAMGGGGTSGGSGPSVEPEPEPAPEPVAVAGAGAGGQPPTNGGAGGSAGSSPGGNAGAGGSTEPPEANLTPVVIVGGFDYSSDGYPLRVYDLDKETGALSQRGNDVDVGPNPSYLALSPSKQFLYVANETDDASGGLSAASIGSDGSLTFLNHQTGSDGGFTYVAVDPSGRFAFGASYNGGSISVFPIEADGRLGPELQNRDFGGGAQSHCIGFDPTGAFVFVPNKGNDEVAQLVLGNDGMVADNEPPRVDTAPGAGPRHFALHPSGSLALVIHELDSTLTAFSLASDGTLEPGATVSTLPPNFNGQNSGAHVEVSPDGRFAYASNRGHDSIAVFSIDTATAGLTLVEHEPTGGRTPRDFEMDPQGDVLIVANQDGGTLAVFSIGDDGTLSALGAPVNGPPSPAAVQLLYLEE